MRKFGWVLLMLLVLGCGEETQDLVKDGVSLEKQQEVLGPSISVEKLIIDLGDEDSYVALKASERLIELGSESVPELLKVMLLPDSGNRVQMTVVTLAGIGTESIIPLVDLLALMTKEQYEKYGDRFNRTLVLIGEPSIQPLTPLLEIKDLEQWPLNRWRYDFVVEVLLAINTPESKSIAQEYISRAKAKIVSVIPPKDEFIRAKQWILITFNQPVTFFEGQWQVDFVLQLGPGLGLHVKGAGKEFSFQLPNVNGLGTVSLDFRWGNPDGSIGTKSIKYKVKPEVVKNADQTAPKISGGNVKNGAKDVDPAPLNEKGITLEFSEAVGQGTAELKPEGGEVLGTEAKWEDKKVTLILLAGKTLANETTYVITVGGVRDVAGNALQGGTVKFTTKGKE